MVNHFEKPELYYFADATCGLKARFAMLEKGVEFIANEVDRYALDAPEYLALNPKAVVPTLVHAGQIIDESTIIGLYIDDAFPGPSLRPDNAYDRARMYRWCKQIDEDYFDAIAAVTFGLALRNKVLHDCASDNDIQEYLERIKVKKKRELREQLLREGASSPLVMQARTTLLGMLQALEQGLEQDSFAAGKTYSLADAFLTPFVMRLEYLGLSDWWSDLENVRSWWQKIQARASYQTILSESFPPSYAENIRALVGELPRSVSAGNS